MDQCFIEGELKTLIYLTLQKETMGHLTHNGFQLALAEMKLNANWYWQCIYDTLGTFGSQWPVRNLQIHFTIELYKI